MGKPNKVQQSGTLLVATPAMAGGSWVCINNFVRTSFSRNKVIVAALGGDQQYSEGMQTFRIPYPSYLKIDPRLGVNVLFILCYSMPLFILMAMLVLIYRPRLIIGNGIITSLALLLPSRLVGAKLIASFHGAVRYTIDESTQRLTRLFCQLVDLVTVNSIGSKEDASLIIKPEKIVIVSHKADNIFFEIRDRELLRNEMGLSDKFVIMYVGRLDIEKSFDVLMNVFKQICDCKEIVLLVVGTGGLQGQVQALAKSNANLRYYGYLSDRAALAKLYTVSDVVWSYADETYLAIPAVEALASGTPIIIPDKPAIYLKALTGCRIDKKLVPSEIGWIVNSSDVSKIINLILAIKDSHAAFELRESCLKYAKENYSKGSLRKTMDEIGEKINCDRHV